MRNESTVTRRTTIELTRGTKEESKKRRLVDSEEYLPRGKRMVSASLQQRREKVGQKRKEEETTAASQKKKAKPSQREIVVPSVKKAIERPNFKELATENLIRDNGARPIGSGTFGTCYPGTYRGISVVIKEYKEKASSRDSNHSLSLLQREAKHEAHVLQQLGDHPGIPLLFGVILKQLPVSLVLKFHGDSGESLTVYKAAKNNKVTEQKEWNRILFYLGYNYYGPFCLWS